jgi:hypothetical protein
MLCAQLRADSHSRVLTLPVFGMDVGVSDSAL